MNIKKKYLPSKRSFVDSFLVMDVLSESKKIESLGKKVFHLELGEPLIRKNEFINKEIHRLVDLNLPGYSPSNGISELRERISEFYLNKSINIDPQQIFITSGSSGAFVLVFLTCFDPVTFTVASKQTACLAPDKCGLDNLPSLEVTPADPAAAECGDTGC